MIVKCVLNVLVSGDGELQYEGNIVDGKKEGHGTQYQYLLKHSQYNSIFIISPGPIRYQGEWHEDLFEGFGLLFL